jgi:hypothetical protein
MSKDDLSFIIQLEEKLLYKQDTHLALAEMIDDEFTEMGSLNHVYTKQDFINDLRLTPEGMRTAKNFKARYIVPEVIHLTYISFIRDSATSPVRSDYRSSIWREKEGAWKLYFHQGTPCR